MLARDFLFVGCQRLLYNFSCFPHTFYSENVNCCKWDIKQLKIGLFGSCIAENRKNRASYMRNGSKSIVELLPFAWWLIYDTMKYQWLFIAVVIHPIKTCWRSWRRLCRRYICRLNCRVWISSRHQSHSQAHWLPTHRGVFPTQVGYKFFSFLLDYWMISPPLALRREFLPKLT